jgi:hypothetical protein
MEKIMAGKKVNVAKEISPKVESFDQLAKEAKVVGLAINHQMAKSDINPILNLLIRIVDACSEGTGVVQPWKSIRDDIERLKQ